MNYLGVDTWEAVLAMFGEGGQFGGNWGWLEVLRQAKLGDSIAMWWSVGGIDAYNSPIAGVFSEDENGQLLFRGTFLGGNWVVSGMTLGQMQSSDGSDILYRVADRYIVNSKHYHLVFHKERVDWLDVGFGIASIQADAGLGIAIAGASHGNVPMALLGATWFVGGESAALAGLIKTYAEVSFGDGNGLDLVVDLGTGVFGLVPELGIPADLIGLGYDLAPGVYYGP